MYAKYGPTDAEIRFVEAAIKTTEVKIDGDK